MSEENTGNNETNGLPPKGGSCGCGCGGSGGCGGGTPNYVYAVGQIQVRYPTIGIEKEFAQALNRAQTAGLTNAQAAYAILSQRENRYLARKVCWVLTIEGIETYVIMPRDAWEVDCLIEALRQNPKATDVDIVIGMRGPLAPPTMCNGLQVPLVGFDQVYSFDTETLLKSIPRPESIPTELFDETVKEVFEYLVQMADNAGATDEHRAQNYLAVRCPAIYAATARAHQHNQCLAGVDVKRSRLYGTRRILDVIFSFQSRTTDVVEKFFVRVDVTDQFPFLVTKFSPYYERV